ncbi:TPA: DUF551 domain-containing protein [Klebsiella pneumoniae]|nr:DUF551 domain-containing protein [Klebsiella pneumoniae]HCF8152046.1 DUF551 domain-containing protein [Klebsiella pneumoniae]
MTKSTITREQLLEIIETDHVQCGEASYLARMALAAMDGEPVAWTWHYREQWHVTSDKGRAAFVATDGDVAVLPLYRHAQSAPVVPKEMTAGIAVKHWEGGRGSIESFVAGYNFCRAAMLQAEPVTTANKLGNSPVIPDTWIPVSERMPEDEQEVLTINRMGHRFVSFFDKHSGLFFDSLDAPAACCIEHVLVTHWMELPAAPQEVKGE